MNRLLERLEQSSRASLMVASLSVLALIGLIDYLSGYELIFSVFYLLAVGLAAWYSGIGFGLVMSILSVTVWMVGDLAAGAHYSSSLVPIWNALILTVFYLIVVLLLNSLRSLQRDLETRVKQRTEALMLEMAKREQLESEILKVSEREQQRLGHDLHDSLCQHLTATALAGQVLGERLAVKSLAEAADAHKIVELVEEGIALARNLARGLYPVAMEAEGLMTALQDLADNLTKRSKIICEFVHEAPVRIHDDITTTHLYRIAQEAATNAMRHGKPKRIVISLSERNGLLTLSVEDDGIGLPETWQSSQGLGIRIMEHRASMIGANLKVEPSLTGGTVVTCSLRQVATPKSKSPLEEHET